MLGAYNPFYQQFGAQQQFKTEADLQREQMANQLAMQRMSSGATLGAAQAANFGKLTSQQNLDLANQQMAQEYMLAGMKYVPQAPAPLPPSPSGGNMFASGMAQGIQAGINSALS